MSLCHLISKQMEMLLFTNVTIVLSVTVQDILCCQFSGHVACHFKDQNNIQRITHRFLKISILIKVIGNSKGKGNLKKWRPFKGKYEDGISKMREVRVSELRKTSMHGYGYCVEQNAVLTSSLESSDSCARSFLSLFWSSWCSEVY